MKYSLLNLSLALVAASSLTNCASSSNQQCTANIIHGTPSGTPMPIYVMATYRDLKAGGLAAGWFRGWTQAEFEFLRLYPDRKICVRDVQTPACREQMPIALVAVPKRYLTGEIPGSLALYHVMSGTGDLIGGAGSLLSGMAWFRGVELDISGDPLATATATAEGGSSTSNSISNSTSSSDSYSSSHSDSSSKSRSEVNNHIGGPPRKKADCKPMHGCD